MAVYFELWSRHYPGDEPMHFQQLDEHICALLGRRPNPEWYHQSWYGIIGFKLALGWNWDKIRQSLLLSLCRCKVITDITQFSELLVICTYLEENYTVKNWYGR